MKRGLFLACLLLAAAALAAAGPVRAEGWRSQQPVAAGVGVPAEIGEVGDLEMWAPNRGMLITAGNEGVPAGLFAYDGSGWYRYSTVCGGHAGRIAYAGPNDFWTVSDQQVGQETGGPPAERVSLCHFVNGAVVASYAEPRGVPESYLPINAAACAGPANCWFAGERLPGTVNVGAFHLHWNGSTVTPVPSLTSTEPELEDPGRAVTGLAHFGDAFYEGVAVRAGDEAPGETASQPTLVHEIVPGGVAPFSPLFGERPISFGSAGASASQLGGFLLSGSGGELWAISGALSAPAQITALRVGGLGLEQVALRDPGSTFGPGYSVDGIAAEANGVWVSYRRVGELEDGPARLARIDPEGNVGEPVTLPGPSEGLGRKGPAGPVACTGPEQCWMATEGGWLFHLGPNPQQDTDPALHALVTYRPPDASLPSVPPVSLPEDNSGAGGAGGKEPSGEPLPLDEEPLPKKAKPLYSKLRQKLLAGNVLQLSFKLRVKAKVRLVAKRHGKVVGQTAPVTLTPGSRQVRLRLDPKRWPTKLDLQVDAVKKPRKHK